MATSLQNLIASIRTNIEEPTAGYWSDDTLTRYINQAIRHINRKTLYLIDAEPATITTSSGTRSYDLPAGCPSAERIAYLCTSEGVPIPPVGLATMRDGNVDLVDGTSSAPSYWYKSGMQIAFYPIPSSSQTIYCWFLKTPAALADAEDTTPFPDEYDDIVEYMVTWMCYAEYEGPQSEKALYWGSLYKDSLDDVNRLLAAYLMGDRRNLNAYGLWPFLEARTGSR